MVRRKPVKSLKYWCLDALPGLLTSHIRKLASKILAAEWFGVLHGQLDVDKDELIRTQVVKLREHILSHVICYDYETMFRIILRSVEDSILITRKSWKPSSDISQYRLDMETMGEFTDLALNPGLQRMDFIDVPNTVRSRIIEKLDSFKNLQTLILRAPAGGQWLFKSINKDIIRGLSSLRRLRKFSLKHDSTNEMIDTLAYKCSEALEVLDIESSKQVTDACLGSLLLCQRLEEVNLFNTGITDEGKGKVIAGLPRLCSLSFRGDYLCDALGWIDYVEDVDDADGEAATVDDIYLIRDFFPSQQYYFHEEWQIEMVSKCCPFINKMFFIFHEDCISDYLILLPFVHLTDLELYGGCFYRDKIAELLQIRGPDLVKLTLTSVRELDFKAFALISVHCRKLKSLSLHGNCEIVDYRPGGNPNSDEEYERRQLFLGMAKNACDTIQTFDNLETISVTSSASSLYLVFVLSKCPSLKSVNLGSHSGLTDESMVKIFLQNPLPDLEEFHCERSLHLSLVSLNLLVHNCDKLKAISDLQCWLALDPVDLSKFRETVREQNMDIDTRSHQKIRKYLDMREFERRTYINLVAGPSMERIRMAERGAHAL